ncbi:type I-F CRISPR-associated endoribonuclease Cas6/Csy4 [Lysobacter pythonis]|uniref:Type I-F CRISPR-associated endoribonuclease Cas6/Csy4 n=1 Tax=Solilutibacter pythonis TaxID=2483112 RepID=A0A3M2HJA4_9GAMM|nr:type I-F CRISPR-associated endoribonuclease Cas6/Csy4 [Lysobacter pythonis]RMH89058.1 type I-F CRISPR-associated endoribonuclease Cas6/Csy4 [Lysobacter pythonis]
MDAYIEITLRPDGEFPRYILMDALIAKFHRALVKAGTERMGVSFPQWSKGKRPTLGGVVRLHGNSEDLKLLMERDWFRGMRDHVRIDGPNPVPAHRTYWRVERQKAKSANNMRKRAMRRHGLSKEEAAKRIPDDAGDWLDLPFTTQRSSSTGQHYRLFINQRQVDSIGSGGFNSHGMSTGSGVPSF